MHKRLYNCLEINEIIHLLQFGFRKKHSTTHALISMTEHFKRSIESGKFGCGIFIDLKKAFDAVNHTILLKNLNIMVLEVFLTNGLSHTYFPEDNLYQ